MASKLIEQLKARREELGISNYKISQLTGISQAELSKLDGGVRGNPTAKTLQKIGSVLGLELTWKKTKKK